MKQLTVLNSRSSRYYSYIKMQVRVTSKSLYISLQSIAGSINANTIMRHQSTRSVEKHPDTEAHLTIKIRITNPKTHSNEYQRKINTKR